MLVLILSTIAGGALSQMAGAQGDPSTLPTQIDKDDPRFSNDTAVNFTGCQSEVCAEDGPIVYMPFGCEGTSANPHKSKTGKKNNKEEITAKSRTKCAVPVSRLEARNNLYRNHFLWWGMEGKPGFAAKFNASFVEAVAVTKCNKE